MTDNSRQSGLGGQVKLETGQVDVQQELDRLQAEIEMLRAAQERLVRAADADRRTIERDLHGGVLQYLVALTAMLQLARIAADSDPAEVKALLEEMGRDVRQVLDETTLFMQRIYPSALELGGLAALLRSAALNAGVRATVDVDAGSSFPPEAGMTVYLAWLALLARGSNESQVTIKVREGENALTFELLGKAAASNADLDRLQDRVEALGGRLTNEPEADGAVRVVGSLPLRR
jgi:signal transduction histidine kinase